MIARAIAPAEPVNTAVSEPALRVIVALKAVDTAPVPAVAGFVVSVGIPEPVPAGGKTIVSAVVRTPVCAPDATDTAILDAVVATDPVASPVRDVAPPPPPGGNTIVEAVVRTPVCAPDATDTFTVPAVVATDPVASPNNPARPEAPVKVCPPIVSLDTARLPPFRLATDIVY